MTGEGMTTPDDLRQLRERATPGPWTKQLVGPTVFPPGALDRWRTEIEHSQPSDEPPVVATLGWASNVEDADSPDAALIVWLVNHAEPLEALWRAAKESAELAPRVPDGNKFGRPWTIPNPVIAALAALEQEQS